MSLLKVESLSVDYMHSAGLFHPRRILHAVSGVSFEIDHGEIVGLVGESGCGKSTIGRAIVGLVRPSAGGIWMDDIPLCGKGVAGRRRSLRGSYQMIFQDPYGALNPRMTVYNTLCEAISLNKDVCRSERRVFAEKLVERVGLEKDVLHRYPHQFSGGQRQRIGIARAIATNPRLIVADEPVSALDVSVQASIINLLGSIRRENGTSFLFVAHDIAVVEHISNRIMVMYLGRIVESGPASSVVGNPLHPYTTALISAVPRMDGSRPRTANLGGDVPSPLDVPIGCPFHPRCPYATKRCASECPKLRNNGDGHMVACFRHEADIR